VRPGYTIAGLVIIGIGGAIIFLTRASRGSPYVLNRIFGVIAGGAAILLGLLLLLYSLLGTHEVVL
jgi:hypothetical protein